MLHIESLSHNELNDWLITLRHAILLTTGLFVQKLFHFNNKETIIVLHTDPLCWKSANNWYIPHTSADNVESMSWHHNNINRMLACGFPHKRPVMWALSWSWHHHDINHFHADLWILGVNIWPMSTYHISWCLGSLLIKWLSSLWWLHYGDTIRHLMSLVTGLFVQKFFKANYKQNY